MRLALNTLSNPCKIAENLVVHGCHGRLASPVTADG